MYIAEKNLGPQQYWSLLPKHAISGSDTISAFKCLSMSHTEDMEALFFATRRFQRGV